MRAGGTAVVAEAVVARWVTPAYAAVHSDEVARFEAMVSSVDREGYAGCCEAIAAMDRRDGLARIAAPTLVLVGRDDPATPVEHAEQIAAGVPGARLEVVPGAHLPERRVRRRHQRPARRAPGALAVTEDGMRVRREVLGDAHVDRAVAATTPLDADFQRWLTDTAWGGLSGPATIASTGGPGRA